VFIFCLTSQIVFAETDTKVVNLNDALFYALAHPRIQGKKKELDVANEKLNTSKWLRYPSVSVISSAGQASLGTRDREPVTTVRLEQPLWAGGRISSSIEASQARLQSSMYGLSEIEQDVLNKTSGAFCSLLKMQEKIEASNENVEEHKRLLGLIQRKARNEVSPMVEIVLAKTRLEQAQYENIQISEKHVNVTANYTKQSIGNYADLLFTTKSGLGWVYGTACPTGWVLLLILGIISFFVSSVS
jgi:adhesin transport system outer membrane protein